MRTDARRRRFNIIRAACRLWRQLPAEEVTLTRVAREAEVGIATVYRNFADRRELSIAAATYLLERAVELQAGALARFDTDPRGSWEGFVRQLVSMGLGTLVPALAPQHLADLPEGMAAIRRQARTNMEALLARAAASGLIGAQVSADEFVSWLTIASRPPVPAVAELNPQANDELIELILEHGRLTAGNATS